MENLYFLVLVLPLLGALGIGLMGFLNPEFRKNEKLIGFLGTAMVAIPFFIVAYAFLNYHEPVDFGLLGGEDSLSWMSGGKLDVFFNYRFDQLSLTMALIVTGVGALIHVYSIGYMHGDRGYYKFFLYLNLFIFAMLNLVLGNNLVVLFLGWEGVGACSYFLIGFWYEEMNNAKAAQKAFVANRIGDFAMIVAMMILFTETGTLTVGGEGGILERIDMLSGSSVWLVPLLLFVAATGKSAQIPLFVWLPDAMAGPTPVSALIHAATMVTSGIYLIARMGDAFLEAPGIMAIVSVVGAMTALMAAMIAVAQNDIKKVLAYSTVSQLGFMFMALGAGAFTTAIFHVMTHAFFKACLFLGSGSVIHAMQHMHTVKDPQDVRTMGGLRKYMPSTHWTFFISTLAIAGIPLLSGFFSKDEIMGKIFFMGDASTVYYMVWIVGMFTALLTAFYMTRVYFLTFRGKERYPNTAHPHESNAYMTFPLWVLAGLATVAGFIGLPAVIGHGKLHFFNHWLSGEGGHGGAVNNDIEHYAHEYVEHYGVIWEWGLILFSIAIAVFGVLIAWNLYKKHGLAGDGIVKKRLGKFYTHMENKFYVDELYQKAIIDPFVFAGKHVVLAFDRWVIDGLVNGIGNLTLFVGDTLKLLQTGLVGQYAMMVVVGVVVILSYLLFV